MSGKALAWVLISLLAAGVLLGGLMAFTRYDELRTQARSQASSQASRTDVEQRMAPGSSRTEPTPPAIRVEVSTNAPVPEVRAIPEGAIPPSSSETPQPLPPVQVEPEPAPAPPVATAQPPNLPGSREVPSEVLNQRPPGLEEAQSPMSGPARLKPAPGRFLFRNRAPSAMAGGTLKPAGEDQAAINVQTFAPQGQTIQVALINSVASTSFEVDVIGGVWLPFVWNGRTVLDVGDRLLGRADAGKNRDRILVTWYKVVDKLGRTMPIQATSLALDGTAGIPGYKVGNIFLSAIGPMLSDLTSGVLSALDEQGQKVDEGLIDLMNSEGGQTGRRSSGGRYVGALTKGTGKAFDRLTEMLMEEMEEKRPFIFVPAGTRCQAYLKEYVDASRLEYGK